MFNAITQSKVLTEDKLFATLDVTTRRIRFPRKGTGHERHGWVHRDLPEALVDAFKATLEESQDADLLIHVVDMSDPQMAAHIESVHEILSDMDLWGMIGSFCSTKPTKLNQSFKKAFACNTAHMSFCTKPKNTPPDPGIDREKALANR